MTKSALARKLSARQGEVDTPRSILRALRLGLARAAGDGMGLALAVIGAKQALRAQEDVTARLKQGWLMLLFGSDQGSMAAVCLDPGCVSAVIQQQTIAIVTSDPPSERMFTDTDAAMVAPLIEDMLGRAQKLVESAADMASLSGFEFTSRAEDRRSLTLALMDEAYRVFDLTVELAGGSRQGEVCVLLPDRPLSDAEQEAENSLAGKNLDQASGVMRAELNALISRISLPLTALSELTVGDVLPLLGARVDRVEVLSIDRARMAIGRLGQCGGMRAVRINEHNPVATLPTTDEQSFLAHKSGPVSKLDDDEKSALLDEEIVTSEQAMNDTLLNPDDILPSNPDQRVAEISHLAGLPAPEGDGPY